MSNQFSMKKNLTIFKDKRLLVNSYRLEDIIDKRNQIEKIFLNKQLNQQENVQLQKDSVQQYISNFQRKRVQQNLLSLENKKMYVQDNHDTKNDIQSSLNLYLPNHQQSSSFRDKCLQVNTENYDNFKIQLEKLSLPTLGQGVTNKQEFKKYRGQIFDQQQYFIKILQNNKYIEENLKDYYQDKLELIKNNEEIQEFFIKNCQNDLNNQGLIKLEILLKLLPQNQNEVNLQILECFFIIQGENCVVKFQKFKLFYQLVINRDLNSQQYIFFIIKFFGINFKTFQEKLFQICQRCEKKNEIYQKLQENLIFSDVMCKKRQIINQCNFKYMLEQKVMPFSIFIVLILNEFKIVKKKLT